MYLNVLFIQIFLYMYLHLHVHIDDNVTALLNLRYHSLLLLLVHLMRSLSGTWRDQMKHLNLE